MLRCFFKQQSILTQSFAYKIVHTLPMEQLAQHVEEESIQSLFRLLRTIRTISPVQAQQLVSSIKVEDLVAKTTVRNFQDMVKQLQVYAYGDETALLILLRH